MVEPEKEIDTLLELLAELEAKAWRPAMPLPLTASTDVATQVATPQYVEAIPGTSVVYPEQLPPASLADNSAVQSFLYMLPYDQQMIVGNVLRALPGVKLWKLSLVCGTALIFGMATGYVAVPFGLDAKAKDVWAKSWTCPVPVQAPPVPVTMPPMEQPK